MRARTVGIISRHAVSNYGSLLQALALQTAIDRMGHKAEHIDYRPAYETAFRRAQNALRDRGKAPWHPELALRMAAFIDQDRFFADLRRQWLHVTPRRYGSLESLRRADFGYDVLMTGSDQVWNTITDDRIDPVYFLAFAPEGPGAPRLASYAASFGRAEVNPRDEGVIRGYLARYDLISVREKSGVGVCRALGADAEHVLDPALLLSGEQWGRLAPPRRPEGFSHDPGAYVLVYNLYRNAALDRYVREVEQRLGLPVVQARPSRAPRYGECVLYPRVENLFWLFKNAACVITDSFHGTVMSLDFQTPFVDVLPEKAAERNRALLAQFALGERVSPGFEGDPSDTSLIDWDRVGMLLSEQRAHSLDVLHRAIEGA